MENRGRRGFDGGDDLLSEDGKDVGLGFSDCHCGDSEPE
jgi:hypothetical protein